MILWGCGTPPGSPPEPLRGNLEVAAFTVPDGEYPDSICIALDGDTLGDWFANPHTFSDLFAGTHLVEVSVLKTIDTVEVEYSGAAQALIEGDSTQQLEIAMLGLAPDFALADFEGDSVWMDSLRGKVVLLYFFAST